MKSESPIKVTYEDLLKTEKSFGNILELDWKKQKDGMKVVRDFRIVKQECDDYRTRLKSIIEKYEGKNIPGGVSFEDDKAEEGVAKINELNAIEVELHIEPLELDKIEELVEGKVNFKDLALLDYYLI